MHIDNSTTPTKLSSGWAQPPTSAMVASCWDCLEARVRGIRMNRQRTDGSASLLRLPAAAGLGMATRPHKTSPTRATFNL